MTASEARRTVSHLLQSLDQFFTGQVAGQLHTVMTSSRVMCKRMIRGISPSSKWQWTASHLPVQALKIICFGKDGFTRGASGIAALGHLLHQK
jgi:hypothetical protein